MYKKQIFHTVNKEIGISWAMQPFSFTLLCDASPLTMSKLSETKIVSSSWEIDFLL